MQHPEGFFFRQEEQQQAGEEVKRLAVADFWAVHGEGVQNVAEGGYEGRFGVEGRGRIGGVREGRGRVDRVGLKVDVVREGAVQVPLD